MGTIKWWIKNAVQKGVSWAQKMAKSISQKKLPRIWGTEMSPVLSKKINNSIKKDFNESQRISDRARYNAWYRYSTSWKELKPGKPVTKKEVLKASVVNPAKSWVKAVANVATIPVRAARNLYNTAADMYNAGVSKRNAKDQAKKLQNSKKK